MKLQGSSSVKLSHLFPETQISLHQQLNFSLLFFRLDLTELTLWDSSIQECVQERGHDQPVLHEESIVLHLWPIEFTFGKHYNRWWHVRKSYATCKKLAALSPQAEVKYATS
jgi:hypothetical protein